MVIILLHVVALLHSNHCLKSAPPRSRRLQTQRQNVETLLDPSYKVAALFIVSGTAFSAMIKFRSISANAVASALLFIGCYLASKTDAVRFKFDDHSLAIVNRDGSSIGQNPVILS